jgi:acyl-CoA hydrolase
MEYEKDWQNLYSDMIATPTQALSHLKSGYRVFIGTGCGAPQELIAAMTARARSVSNVEIIQLITKGEAPYADKKMSESLRSTLFSSAPTSAASFRRGSATTPRSSCPTCPNCSIPAACPSISP